MAEPRTPVPALLVVAAFSRYQDVLTWASERLSAEYGSIAAAGPVFSFHQTSYYEPTMGAGLQKQLLAFAQLVPQDALAAIKLHTNALEAELAATGWFPESRPLNLDPCLLTLGKFLLATTKDQAHRIYLGLGIYAEATLRFEAGEYVAWPWTYADYREPEVRATLKAFRDEYKRLAAAQGP